MSKRLTYMHPPPHAAVRLLNTMIDKFILAFKGAARTPMANAREQAVREIVRAHSHGNIRLQWGQFYTKTDVDAKFARLRGARFVDRRHS